MDKKAWLPQWQEVIVLLAGKLTDPKPLLTILSNPKPTRTNRHGDDYFRHRLALAALCLPEIVLRLRTPNSELGTQHSELFDSITTAAFDLWWQRQRDGTVAAVPHLTRALPALGQVNAKLNGTPLLDYLTRLLTASEWDVRRAAAAAVGRLGSAAATPEILARLTRLLTDLERDVRRAAAEAVGRLGSVAATPEILARLTRLLADLEWYVRRAAAAAVGRLGSVAATPEILAHLARLLTDSERDVHRVAAEAVEGLMVQDVRIFKLSKWLRKKWEGWSVAELSQ